MNVIFEKRWRFKETELLIKSDFERAIKYSIKATMEARRQLERIVIREPDFRNSLEPISAKIEDKTRIVDLMLRASEIADIGPFSAVAGSISQIAAEAGIASGGSNILVDNGGDISLIGDREFRVGVYAEDSPISGKIALSVKGKELPMGICTSSGSVGHSISFGEADAVVVIADEASIADAAATSVANAVRGDDIESSIKNGLDRFDDISEGSGSIIIRGDRIGTVGKLPQILTVQGKTKVHPTELGASSPLSWGEPVIE